MYEKHIYIKLKNEVDRFGFSYYLKSLIKPHFILSHIHCTWVHAWKWFDISEIEFLGLNKLGYTVNAVVTNQKQYNLLKSAGFKNVFIGGLPYIYIDVEPITKKKDTLLAILPKSKGYKPIRKNLLSFIDYIKDNQKNFEETCVCIFGGDMKNIELLEKLKKYKLKYIIGAIPEEINSLKRVKSLFSYYDYCVFNSIGSHVVYAALSGCKIGFDGDYDERSEEFFINNKLWDSNKKIREMMIYFDSLNYVKKKLPKLFGMKISNFESQIEWGESECGKENKLELSNIKEILGWSIKGKIQGIKNSLLWRL